MDLWSFALRTYAAPGVAQDCLDLQEAHDVDVPLLLWAAWAAGTGRRLDPAALALAEAAVADWRVQVVRPLRAVRRWMKDNPGPADAASDATAEALRERIKGAELSAEKLQMEALEALPTEAASGVSNVPEALEGVVALSATRPLDRDDRDRLARVAEAARVALTDS